MTRRIVYDATHLVSLGTASGAAGIGRLDLAFARHFAAHPRLACGAHYGARGPHALAPSRLSRIVADVGAASAPDDSAEWTRLRGWLLGEEAAPFASAPASRSALGQFLWRAPLRLANDRPRALPPGALYLNIAQHACEFPLLFRWLERRPDMRAVFFVHDLLPLDRPEFFRRGYEALFRRRIDTILRHAHALLTTTEIVAERLEREMARSATRVPIHSEPPPSTLEDITESARDEELARRDYFVLLSTLEPRKNHLMLLNVWRALAAGPQPAPKLVLVGGRGWENEQIVGMLNRCEAIRPCVRWATGLPAAQLRRLLSNANALLMPSFAEGYGLPVVEALSLGTPAIVSDIPVFHEIAQERALFLSPIDGLGWKRAIEDFSTADSPRRLAAIDAARRFEAPNWTRYFERVETFLDRL
ncbi:glycosyl transferase group 1 [Methylosinus sp. R-45379]|uniref:glycosyltransferase family 4 protein n=1 Tax=Methylosinus sp. R-45379 TaxID=980563 RepID=UPI0007C8D281|nr:glycosyltransferase family 1 protein [Methylosinus sp. R-45379]OAI30970.1 glycosyl transferase group 1 [Methylosinus sp. R-45379]